MPKIRSGNFLQRIVSFFQGREVSLRFAILTTFILLYLLTAVIIYYIRSIAYTDEIRYVSRSLMHHASDMVYRELEFGMKPIEIQGNFTAKLIQNGVVSLNEKELIPYLNSLLNTMPLVRSVFIGNEGGDFVVARKENNNAVTIETYWKTGKNKHEIIYHDINGNITQRETFPDNNYDPRIRPWYQFAKSNNKLQWMNIFNYSYAKKGITLTVPIFNKEKTLTSVLGFVVSLDYLNQFIVNQKVAKNGYSFIITKNGELISFPYREDQLSNPLIKDSLASYLKVPFDEMEFKYKGKIYLISYTPVIDLGNSEWLIGIVVPKTDFTGFLTRLNYASSVIILCVLALGILLLSNLVSRVVRPIKLLVRETRKIRDFDLENEIKLNSSIYEVNYLKNSLNSMRRGLKHFQKYIPKTLVHQLIESGQDMRIGGVKRNLVVMFSDIENFTMIAEKVDPQQLMVQVCEYFETVTTIIIEEKGTIDKYIGDSVMSFWGAPLVEADPCLHAAKAAIRCQRRLVELNQAWRERGWPVFITRIGIHRGDAIVGNVGSSERLNYTALGDTINITNRLEGINKDYNTKIIVSDTVYQDIKDHFILREVDSVMLKGIAKPMKVYELLGDSMKDIKFDIEAFREEFEQGLQTFHQDKFDLALDHFNKCLKIYPDDYLVPKFIQQCEAQLHI